MGTFLLSWLAYPLAVLVLCVGIGLLVRRIAGSPALPGVLLLPIGFAGLVVVVVFFTLASTTAPLAGVALVVTAVVGFAVARRELRAVLRPSRVWLWPGLAALLPAGSIAAPIVLTGQAGLTGYGRIVDTAHQLMFAVWLKGEGRTVPVEGLVGRGHDCATQSPRSSASCAQRTPPWTGSRSSCLQGRRRATAPRSRREQPAEGSAAEAGPTVSVRNVGRPGVSLPRIPW